MNFRVTPMNSEDPQSSSAANIQERSAPISVEPTTSAMFAKTDPAQKIKMQDEANVSAEQIRASYAHAVKAGALTSEEANARLASEHGLSALAAETDPNSFSSMFDRNFAPAKPNEYSLPSMPFGASPQKEKNIEVWSKGFREWLSAASFPKELGNSFVETIDRENRSLSYKKSETERAEWKMRQANDLRAIWGDNFDANLKLTETFLRSTDSKAIGVSEFLRKTDLAHSAAIINQLFHQATRLKIRKGDGD